MKTNPKKKKNGGERIQIIESELRWVSDRGGVGINGKVKTQGEGEWERWRGAAMRLWGWECGCVGWWDWLRLREWDRVLEFGSVRYIYIYIYIKWTCMCGGRECIIPELDPNPLQVELLEPKPTPIISWVD